MEEFLYDRMGEFPQMRMREFHPGRIGGFHQMGEFPPRRMGEFHPMGEVPTRRMREFHLERIGGFPQMVEFPQMGEFPHRRMGEFLPGRIGGFPQMGEFHPIVDFPQRRMGEFHPIVDFPQRRMGEFPQMVDFPDRRMGEFPQMVDFPDRRMGEFPQMVDFPDRRMGEFPQMVDFPDRRMGEFPQMVDFPDRRMGEFPQMVDFPDRRMGEFPQMVDFPDRRMGEFPQMVDFPDRRMGEFPQMVDFPDRRMGEFPQMVDFPDRRMGEFPQMVDFPDRRMGEFPQMVDFPDRRMGEFPQMVDFPDRRMGEFPQMVDFPDRRMVEFSQMLELPPKRMEPRQEDLNLENTRGTVRILWCILTLVSAILVQKNNWINLLISLTTGELIGYLTMKTLTSTKIMISPNTLWIHIVDGINIGVPILYYLEDADDWATILRGTLGLLYIFLCTTNLIHIFMKIVYLFLVVGCLHRFFGYTSFPALLISILFGGGCLLLILRTHLGEKKKEVGGMGYVGDTNMDMDEPETWSLKEEIRTNREKEEWIDLGLKALGIGTPLGFAIYHYFTYRSTFYIPLFFLLLQLFLLSCLFTTFSFLNNLFRIYITSFIDIMHRTKTLLILGIVFGGVIYIWSLMGVGSLSHEYSLTHTTHIYFNASQAQINFMEDSHLSDSYIRIQSEYQGKLKVIHQDGMLNFTLMGGVELLYIMVDSSAKIRPRTLIYMYEYIYIYIYRV